MEASSKSKVLIVDDMPENIRILMEILKGDYAVQAATSGEKALNMVSGDAPPDLILLDIEMPGMDGYEVIRRLKADENSRDIPVVFVSGLSDTEDETKGLGLGAIDYITKPVSPPIVRARVKNHLELKHFRDREKDYIQLLQQEKIKADNLLSNVLPESVVDQLKEQKGALAESHPEATVLFSDIVGFTDLSGQIPVKQLVTMLNNIFSAFDALVEKHGLEKIKTIGDAYMVVGGIPEFRDDHTEKAADMALDMLDEINKYSGLDGQPLKIRIGLNTGPVMAGVIGVKKFIYDLWGDTVNIASRMESHGVPGCIQVSPMTYHRLRDKYYLEKRGVINIKGKGEMITYFLIGRNDSVRTEQVVQARQEQGEAGYGLVRAMEELATLPLSDDLTGVHSRNGFAALARQQLAVAAREQRKALLLLVCLDNLEWINSEYGFEEGDRALKELARLLYVVFRISDLVGRVSEHLFLVFGLEVTVVEHDVLAARFRKMYENFVDESDLDYELKISLAGAAWDPTAPRPLEALLSEMELSLKEL